MKSREWDLHYTRGKSALTYPDENLVRLLGRELNSRKAAGLKALDTGWEAADTSFF